MNTYNLFISHSWAYGDQYKNLVSHLDNSRYFSYKNYSVPQHSPIHSANNDRELYEAIKRQIAPSSVVLILAGVYSTYSKWINKEIQIAKNEFMNPKRIIAIEPFGSERTSAIVRGQADIVVKMQTEKIIEAIRKFG